MRRVFDAENMVYLSYSHNREMLWKWICLAGGNIDNRIIAGYAELPLDEVKS